MQTVLFECLGLLILCSEISIDVFLLLLILPKQHSKLPPVPIDAGKDTFNAELSWFPQDEINDHYTSIFRRYDDGMHHEIWEIQGFGHVEHLFHLGVTPWQDQLFCDIQKQVVLQPHGRTSPLSEFSHLPLYQHYS